MFDAGSSGPYKVLRTLWEYAKLYLINDCQIHPCVLFDISYTPSPAPVFRFPSKLLIQVDKILANYWLQLPGAISDSNWAKPQSPFDDQVQGVGNACFEATKVWKQIRDSPHTICVNSGRLSSSLPSQLPHEKIRTIVSMPWDYCE